ncbi:MAG: OmpW family outer membrane protein [Kofleriaceae bacterium]
MKRLLLALLCTAVVAPVASAQAPKPATQKKSKAKPKKPTPKEPEPEIEMEPIAATPAPAPVLDTEKPLADPAPAPAATVSVSATNKSRMPKKLKRFYVRGGVAHIAPLSQSRELELADIDGAASLAIDNGPIAGSGSSVSSATVPAITLGYKLSKRLSIETVLGLPFTVKFRATGTLANESIAPMALGIPTGVPPLGSELGEAKAAPPTVTLVYQLRPDSAIRPYAGAGAAILMAFDAHVTNPILTEVSQPDMSIAPAPGLVLQTGAEATIYKSIYARLDVKFIAFMLARAKVEHIEVKTPELPVFDTVEVGTAKMSVWVNPLIIQLGIGVDF